jgi:cytochrome c-type biogenesis protein CcmH/NrfG
MVPAWTKQLGLSGGGGWLRRVVLAIVCLGLTAGGMWCYFHFRAPAPVEPPNIKVDSGADSEVITAIARSRHMVLDDPRSGDAWGDLGMVFGAHGYESEADLCFAEAARLAPSDARWAYFRGVFASVHQPQLAIAAFRRAVAADPPNQEIRSVLRLRLAEALLGVGEVDEAQAIFSNENDRDPANPRAVFGLAQVALARGEQSDVKALLLKIENDPFARQRAALLLAAIAQESGHGEADRYANAAARLPPDPSWPDPYLIQLRSREVGLQGLLMEAESLEMAGQLNGAAQMLLELADSHPLPRVLVATAVVLAKLRDYTRAELFLRKCLSQDSKHTQGNYTLAVVLFEEATRPDSNLTLNERRSQLQESVGAAKQAISSKPDHGMAWLYLGRAHLELHEISSALEALEQATACRPEVCDTHLYLAEALAAKGDLVAAREQAKFALKLCSPGDTRPAKLTDRLAKD